MCANKNFSSLYNSFDSVRSFFKSSGIASWSISFYSKSYRGRKFSPSLPFWLVFKSCIFSSVDWSVCQRWSSHGDWGDQCCLLFFTSDQTEPCSESRIFSLPSSIERSLGLSSSTKQLSRRYARIRCGTCRISRALSGLDKRSIDLRVKRGEILSTSSNYLASPRGFKPWRRSSCHTSNMTHGLVWVRVGSSFFRCWSRKMCL